MIPKVIHYCWFGGKPIDKLGEKCIASWKKYCPDYEIKRWDESNYNLEACDYVKEAYQAKKWAFVSDYVRFDILYHYGGLYFDTDVELIKPIDDIVSKGPFMGCESHQKKSTVAPGLGLAANPGLGLYKDILDYYNRQHFISSDGSINLETVVQRVTNILIDQGFQGNGNIELINDVYIYPSEYFGPIDPVTKQKHITSNTRSIHHYSASWCDDGSKRRGQIYKMLYRLFGARGANTVKNIWHTFSKNRQ
jgi:hypothetical protein